MAGRGVRDQEPGEEAAAVADEAAFRRRCADLTADAGRMLAVIMAIVIPLLWPTDRIFFGDSPLYQAFFAWRLPIFALSLAVVAGFTFAPICRRHAALVLSLALIVGAVVCGLAIGAVGRDGEAFFACSYLLPLATISILAPLPARIAVNIGLALAFTGPYCLVHRAYLETPTGIPSILFEGFVVLASVAIGRRIYELVRRDFAQREVLREQAAELAVAREKSERLLLNILPQTVAAQLKDGAASIADAYDDVTVLFVDICGFTGLSEGAPAAEVVQMLGAVFSAFDLLVERRGVEKIKTIGDAYMVAAGLPRPRPDHAEAIAELALDMLEASRGFTAPGGQPLQVRIGAASGPVVAGVIGRKKFIYDLWGDTVNTASRMESHGEPGTIQVTAALGARLARRFDVEPRGAILVKGKGTMETCFLRGRRGEPRVGGSSSGA
ncbi:MAG: adenylate/guanylate cyclase domain-containing protein [Nannocystaceae bacterium]